MNTLASRLRSEREAKGWSQPELAKRSGVKQSFIGALEAENQKNSGWLPELANALGVDAYWLKTGKGKKTLTAPQGDTPPLSEYKPTVISDTRRLSIEDSYAKVVALPSSLIEELMAIAAKINETGLNRLIGQAQMLAEQYPKPSSGNVAQ